MLRTISFKSVQKARSQFSPKLLNVFRMHALFGCPGMLKVPPPGLAALRDRPVLMHAETQCFTSKISKDREKMHINVIG